MQRTARQLSRPITVELTDAFTEARTQMDRVIERDVRFDIGGDRQRIHHIDTDISDVTFKHILLPVWTAAYKYRGQSYRFVVNGRTGQVRGERPWSAIKILIAVVIGLAVAAGAFAYGLALRLVAPELLRRVWVLAADALPIRRIKPQAREA